jgi:hypothetical protein
MTRSPFGSALTLTVAFALALLGCSSSDSSNTLDATADATADGGLSDGTAPAPDTSGGLDLAPADAPPADSAPADRAADATAPDAAADLPVDLRVVDAATPDAPPPDAATPDAAVAMCGPIRCDCTFKGKKLWGKVKFVSALDFPDVTVQVVTTNLADLYVQRLSFPQIPSRCGQWLEEQDFPDFKVRIADFAELADFKIQYDSFMPGLPGMR